MSTRYTAAIDLLNSNDSHVLAIASVPNRCRVLDVGLADGSTASVLKRMGCSVWGIEVDEAAAAEAAKLCDRVIVGDVESIDLNEALGSQRFEVILMLDILEHLAKPDRLLRDLKHFLDPHGYVVISLPNVAHGAVRLQLLSGRFTYTDLGLLDRTHLRFFDRQGAFDLCEQAGYEVIDIARTLRSLDSTEIAVDLNNVDPGVLAEIERDPEALTYQFVLTVAPFGSIAQADPPVLMARLLQEYIRERDYMPGGAGHNPAVDWALGALDSMRAESDVRNKLLRRLVDELRSE